LDRLWLVAPKSFPCAEATARASGADDVLARARVCHTLDEALSGCRLVAGSSARLRAVPCPSLAPQAGAERLVAESRLAPVALLFGRESAGLSNEEIDRCHLLVHIPANPQYSSLNLASAVQVLAYELRVASGVSGPEPLRSEITDDVAEAGQLEGFFGHLEQALFDLGFAHPRQADKLLRRLRRLFLRARPTTEEINILRGILSAAQGRKSMRR